MPPRKVPPAAPGRPWRCRDPRGEVLELEAGEDNRDDEGGKTPPGGEGEQSAEEGVGADDDERDAGEQQRDCREGWHRD